MSRLISELYGALVSWKWVLAYTALLLLSLNYTRRLLDALEQRNLSGLLGLSLVLVCVGCVLFLFHRAYRIEGGFKSSTVLRLVGFLALYACCMFGSTNLIVDRIHFVEYGILGLLCFRAVSPRNGTLRRVSRTMVAVFTIGFVDEVIQGLLPIRYYVLQDLVIDILAGFLPVFGLLWLPLSRTEPQKPDKTILFEERSVRERPSRRLQPADTGTLLWALFLVLGAVWIGRVAWDLEPLFGQWERKNRCQRIERIQVRRDGTILWEDAAGGRAKGHYRVSGNRLDGPLLEIRVLWGEGTDPCSWRTAEGRARYFDVNAQRLVFKKEREFPFLRISPLPPSRSRVPSSGGPVT